MIDVGRFYILRHFNVEWQFCQHVLEMHKELITKSQASVIALSILNIFCCLSCRLVASVSCLNSQQCSVASLRKVA